VGKHPDRLIPQPGRAAELKVRTLTHLCNQRPSRLNHAYRTVDKVTAMACGWSVDLSENTAAMVEAGAAPWRKPWTTPRLPRVPALPVNAATGQSYHGINVLLLLPLSMLFGDLRWCSYRQAEARGWQVRHGERGTPICFYKLLEIALEDRDDLRAILGDLDEAVRTVPLLRPDCSTP